MESSCIDDNSTRTPPQLTHELISDDMLPVPGAELEAEAQCEDLV